MRGLLLLISGFSMIGCVGPLPSAPKVAARAAPRHLSTTDQLNLQAGTYPLPPDTLIALQPFPTEGKFTMELLKTGISFDMAPLRNPAVFVHLLPGKGQPALSLEERAKVEALAARHNVRLVRPGEIDVRFGPDGKTPLVMRDPLPVLPKSESVWYITRITFPSRKVASQAAAYVDRSDYRVRVEADGARGVLVCESRERGVETDDEGLAFAPLARKFGGGTPDVTARWEGVRNR